jgi:hypothetical protein
MCNYNSINAEVVTDTEAVGLQVPVTRVGRLIGERHNTRCHASRYRVTAINFNNLYYFIYGTEL